MFAVCPAVARGLRAADAAAYIARRLDVIAEETERGWAGEPTTDGGLSFTREVRGVKEAWTLDGKLIGSADALRLDRKAEHLQEIYARPARLRRKDGETVIHGIARIDRVILFGQMARHDGAAVAGHGNADIGGTGFDPAFQP